MNVLKIPVSSEGLQWYQYVRHDIQEQELEGKYQTNNLRRFQYFNNFQSFSFHLIDISKEYLTIYDKCLPKIQKKLGKTKVCIHFFVAYLYRGLKMLQFFDLNVGNTSQNQQI